MRFNWCVIFKQLFLHVAAKITPGLTFVTDYALHSCVIIKWEAIL